MRGHSHRSVRHPPLRGYRRAPPTGSKLHKIHRAKSKEAHSRSYEPLGPVLTFEQRRAVTNRARKYSPGVGPGARRTGEAVARCYISYYHNRSLIAILDRVMISCLFAHRTKQTDLFNRPARDVCLMLAYAL